MANEQTSISTDGQTFDFGGFGVMGTRTPDRRACALPGDDLEGATGTLLPVDPCLALRQGPHLPFCRPTSGLRIRA